MNASLWLLIGVASLTAAAQAAAGEGGNGAASGRLAHGWAQLALEEALITSREIPDPFHHAQALAGIAEAQLIVGDSATALSLLQDAVTLTGKIDSDALNSWARHDIALAYVKADDLAGAEATASGMSDERLRDEVLAAIVDARRADHDFANAVSFARRIRDVARQGQVLRSIVIAQASAGDVEAALVTARSIVDPTANAMALGDVATTYAKDGSFREARLLAVRIRDERLRGATLIEISSAQAQSGDIRGALTTAEAIEDKLLRAQALARAGAARVRNGARAGGKELFEQAKQLVKAGRGSDERKGYTFVEIARAQSSVGDTAGAQQSLQLALTALQDVKRPSDRLSLVTQIAPMQARLGDHSSAMATAWRAEDASLRPLLVRDVIAYQAEAGDIAGAVQAAGAIDDLPAGAAAFFGILRVQSQASDSPGMHSTIEAALRTVRVIRDDELKAGALGSLAAAQLVAGDADAARALFDEAMSVAARTVAGPARAGAYARIADALGERGR